MIGIILNVSCSVTKTNSPFVRVKYRTLESSGELSVWAVPASDAPSVGDYFQTLDSCIKNSNGYLSVGSNSITFSKILPDKVLEKKLNAFIEKPVPYDEWSSVIYDLLKKFNDKKLSKFVDFIQLNLFKKYSKVPGGKVNHQPYEGGLITHTYQMLNMLNALYPVYPFKVNIDICTIAILFHDYGKIFEYVKNNQGSFDFTKYVFLEGHVYMSAHLFEVAFVHWKDLSSYNDKNDAQVQITHAILAHHGKKEWGSPEEPATQEAFLVHTLDMLSGMGDPYDKASDMERTFAVGTVIKFDYGK